MVRTLRNTPDAPAATTADAEPVWELAELYPLQGEWNESEYIYLPTNRLVELVDGRIEFPPMPTDSHQSIVAFLFLLLKAHLDPSGGIVRFAPLRLRIRANRMREPDVMLLLPARRHLLGERFWTGADLVVEVVSEDDPERDWVTKRADYAEAQVPEYWIVDPRDSTITVLVLEGAAYVENARYARGQRATSPLLPGLDIDTAAVFDAAKI